jgi:hypothetical protein
VALAAVGQNGNALVHVAKPLRADRELVLAAASTSGSAMAHAAVDLRGDRALLLLAVQRSGAALAHATAAIRRDQEVALAAIVQSGANLKYVAVELQHNPAFLANALAKNNLSLEDTPAGENLASGKRHRKELLLEDLSAELGADGFFVLAATERRGRALQGAPKSGVGSSFGFSLRKAEGVGFGLETLCRTSCRALCVQSVSAEGAVSAWNKQADLDRRVLPGDLLVGVNGIALDEGAMVAELELVTSASLEFVRGREHADYQVPASVAPPLAAPASWGEGWGWQAGSADGWSEKGSAYGWSGSASVAPPPAARAWRGEWAGRQAGSADDGSWWSASAAPPPMAARGGRRGEAASVAGSAGGGSWWSSGEASSREWRGGWETSVESSWSKRTSKASWAESVWQVPVWQ